MSLIVDESIGMMSDAYFASRSTILQWLNTILGFNYSKIEQCASGVAACQVFDALFPNTVRLEKVNFSAKREYEFIQNYKVLQAAFNRVKIEKRIDVERLVKAKYQDNLEFMQWVKGFFDQHASNDALQYDGASRRRELGIVDENTSKQHRPTKLARQPAAACEKFSSNGNMSRPAASAVGARAPTRRPVQSRLKENLTANSSPVVKKTQFDSLQAELEEMRQTCEETETELEFFYKKLVDIEMIIQSFEDDNQDKELDPVLGEIKNVLYRPQGAGNTPEKEQPGDLSVNATDEEG